MPREAGLFEAAKGSPLKGYMLIKKAKKNIPPSWHKRARVSRKNREEQVTRVLHKRSIADRSILKKWEQDFMKECFYRGVRALLELDRIGLTRL
jgi:hypothetical protein